MSNGACSVKPRRGSSRCLPRPSAGRTGCFRALQAACCWAGWAVAVAAADPITFQPGGDRVVIQPPGKSSRVIVTGFIDDFTGRGLILQTRRGTGAVRYSREEILEVSTTQVEQHALGRKLFGEGRIIEAERAFKDALEEEDRPWVRRDILASLVKCGLWQGDYRAAAQHFLSIVESDPETLYFGLIPLAWQDAPPTGQAAIDARRWLHSESPTARLIGASWLWDGDREPSATRALHELAAGAHPLLQRLAQTQLWRARLRSGEVTALECQRWRQFVDDLPAEIRAGPLFLIGCAAAQLHDDLNAAAAWLWLPFEYPHDRHLAAAAQVRAAEILLRAGNIPAARQQAQETLMRWADTPAASLAKAVLDGLAADDS